MSLTPNLALVPDRDSLPFKKRDQKQILAPQEQQQQQQQQCDAATFKAPYPYKSHSELKAKHTGPFQPVPRRVPALYQPWIQTHTSTRSKPHELSAFRANHGWTDWREFNPLRPGWEFSHHYQHHVHFPSTPALQSSYPHHPFRFTSVSEEFHRVGGEYGWEQLKILRDKSLNADRQSNDKNKGPYVRRRKRKFEYFPKAENASPPSSRTCLPHSPQDDLCLQHDLLHESASGHSFINSETTCTSMKEDTSRTPDLLSSEHAPSSPSSANSFPWLLPHFMAGSLIELRDGRLRRVEHLQTEDFLLGSLACPDLCLSCCTVQNISPSASPSISRLLILLHDKQSQELVDVYVEYPFFVRGQGWSSCSPLKTARLCGLQCRQLSVGDVCLALTPVSAPRLPQSATLEPKPSPRKAMGGCEPLIVPPPQVPSGPLRPTGGQKKQTEGGRRRHNSAPELRGPGTNYI